jgi:predicted ATPase
MSWNDASGQMPESLGPYLVLERLGRGGMGVVYRGRHRDSGELAAVKTVPVPEAALLQSLRREIHALARLRHPGIARILDSGVQDGLPWIAMELVEGMSLRRYAEAQRPPLQRILTVVRRLCSALVYLHGEGLVHRDLKPDNVIVKPEGWPVLVDFGLSLRFSGPLSRELLEVDTGTSGTSAYMAPEQLRGEPVDARADLYSLGCLLYGLLTGHTPFRSVDEVLDPELAPEPPSGLAPGLGPALDAVVLRLLCKEPRERPGHASVVDAELAALGAEDGWSASAPRPLPYLYRPGLAGRGEALRALGRMLGEHLASGQGGLMLLGGESGVGKTRLVMEVASAVQRRGLQVLLGECLPATVGGRESRAENELRAGPAPVSSEPLQALLRPLQQVADRCRQGGRAETDRLLGQHGPVLALYEPALAALPGQKDRPPPAELPAEAARLRLFCALADTFAALLEADWSLPASQARPGSPLLMVLDDLQWADELSLGFLRFLLRSGRLQRMALVVLGTFRSEDVEAAGRWALQSLLEEPGCRRLELERLEEASVGEMIGDMLAMQVPAELVRSLARHTEGNPFFVAEYLRTAVSEGLLDRDEQGRWRLSEGGALEQASLEALPLPHSVRELVGRRLEGLPEDAAAVAAAAAVLGREVPLSLLAEMSALAEEARLGALTELLRRQVLEEAGAAGVRFVHDKIREVAYARIGDAERRRLHRAAAEAIEEVHAEQRAEHLGALGRHWEEAGEEDRARSCFLEAARRAAKRSSFEEGVRLARRAKRLGGGAAAQLVLAEALAELSRHDEALAEAREIVAFPETRAEERAEAGVRIAQVLSHQGRAAEVLLQVEEVLRSRPTDLFRRLALQTRAAALQQLGRYDEALAGAGEARALAQSIGDAAGVAAALDRMGMIHRDRGAPAEALACSQEALVIARRLGQRRAVANLLNNAGIAHWHRGAYDEAQACYEESLATHREIGYRAGIANNLANLGVLRMERGAYAEALGLFREALAIQREVGARHWIATCLLNIGSAHGSRGELDESLNALQQAQAVLREVQNPIIESATLACLGSSYASLERLDEAEQAFAEGIRIAEAHGFTYYLAENVLARARARLEHRPREGREDAERALALWIEARNPLREGAALATLARYDALDGHPSAAQEKFARARALVPEGGDFNLYVQVLEDDAAIRLAAGDREEAERIARQAAELARSHGAGTALRRIERILDALKGGSMS